MSDDKNPEEGWPLLRVITDKVEAREALLPELSGKVIPFPLPRTYLDCEQGVDWDMARKLGIEPPRQESGHESGQSGRIREE